MHTPASPTLRFNRTIRPHPGLVGRPLVGPAPSPSPRDGAKPLPGTSAPKPERERRTTPSLIEADAETFLSRTPYGSVAEVGVRLWLRRAGLNVRRASDAQHLRAIAHAYAAHVRIAASPERGPIMAELEEALGRRRSAATHDLHLIMEHFVSYGGDSAAERLAGRKLISRDVRAIQHLRAEKVLASEVQALGARPGEGLHAWATRGTASRRARPNRRSSAGTGEIVRSEQRQRALVHEVMLITRRPDGSEKGRSRFAITGVLRAEIEAVTRRLTTLERRVTDAAASDTG